MTEIEKLTAGHPDTQSADIVAGNIEALRALFPEAFTEGKIDFEVLKQCLGGAVDEREEKYGLNWHGKRRARQIALTPSTGTLLPCPEDSVDWDTTQNLMIEGDNLEVLKLLQKSYSGKVKLIYIDPPYNTGKDFVYPDDFRDGVTNYLQITGQSDGEGKKLSSSSESSGRFHTQWLNMMLPRVKLARSMLQPDGYIVVSIDDAEANNFHALLCEIFGEENHVATLVWDRNRKNDAKLFSVGHEYMIIFCKDRSLLQAMGVKLREPKEGIDEAREFFKSLRLKHSDDWSEVRTEWRSFFASLGEDDQRKKLGRFTKVGERGPYRDDGDISWPGGGGPKYEVLHPVTGRPVKVPAGGWVYPTKDGFDSAVALGRVVFGDDETTLPRQIRYLFESEGQVMPSVHYSYAQTATVNFVNLMGSRVFENPKNWTDIGRIVSYLTGPSDIVLDFFAGSGTTGHAVMERNSDELTNRRFILVQLPELIADDKDNSVPIEFLQKRKRPLNIAEITKERLRLAGNKLKLNAGKTGNDTGFRVYKFAASNIRPWSPDASDLAGTLLAHAEHIVPGRTEADILTELLLKLGLDLCVPIETKDIAGKSVHSVGSGALIVCLSDGITRETVEGLAQGIIAWWQALAPAGDTRIVFKDSAFADDVAKTNMAAILNQAGIKDMRSL